MPKGLYVDKPQNVEIREYDDGALQGNQVRIQTEFAAIKHGTLFRLFSGTSPFEKGRFDPELRLFVETDRSNSTGGLLNRFIGNMVVGVVVETGHAVSRFATGDRVYCYGPVCETVTSLDSQVHPLLPPMDALDAVCTDPALYAYAVMRDARVCLGDNVVVFGLGAIGLFVVQMLKLAGCLNIIAVDPIEKRRRLAEHYGAGLALDPASCDVGLVVREHIGQGADIAIEASGHYQALRDAMRAVGKCARVVTLGYYGGQPVDLALGAEWHHNRLELISSMPVWDNPLREHPVWDRERLFQTVVEMFRKGSLTAAQIVDPIVDFGASAQAFMDIFGDPLEAVKLGIRFLVEDENGDERRNQSQGWGSGQFTRPGRGAQ